MRFVLAVLSLVLMIAGIQLPARSGDVGVTRDLTDLQTAFAATGAGLERVLLVGSTNVQDPEAFHQAKALLGWDDLATAPPDEERVIRKYDHDGELYVAVQWALSGQAALGWRTRQAELAAALSAVSVNTPRLNVQLEGKTSSANLTGVAERALNVVAAKRREPWSAPASVSIAGWSDRLPAGAYPVNVQVAVRRDSAGNDARVWLAWPTLLQEY